MLGLSFSDRIDPLHYRPFIQFSLIFETTIFSIPTFLAQAARRGTPLVERLISSQRALQKGAYSQPLGTPGHHKVTIVIPSQASPHVGT